MTSQPRPSVPPTWQSPKLEITPLWTERDVAAFDLWQNISIGVWVGQATLPAVRALLRMSERMESSFPSGRSSVLFVLDQVAAPTPEARAELAKVYASPGLACTAIVLEGSGFWASAIRSMSSNLARAGSVTLRVNTSIDEVVQWFPAEHRARTGVALQSNDMKRALMHARRAAEQRARGE
jgi:hypothetical protein